MVLPITGPLVTTYYTDSGRERTSQEVYKQVKPFDRPLPYAVTKTKGWNRQQTSSASGFWDSEKVPNLSWSTSGSVPGYTRYRSSAYNAAFERLRGKIGDSAGWAENIAQFRSAADMINGRCEQLARFFVNLRKGQFKKAAQGLKSPQPRNLRDGDKAFAGNVLEWYYGWAPLLSDISSSVSILTDTEFVSRRLEAKSSEVWGFSDSNTTTNWLGTESIWWFITAQIKARIACKARIDNPNLFLAGSMGLIDPALPWKLVPFSFVADWFVNVEQVISSITGFLGVQLEHPYHSYRINSSGFGRTTTTFTEWYPQHLAVLSSYSRTESYGMEDRFERHLGIPSPELIVKPFHGFSLSRGLQAIALIIAVFK